ncbi:hypothetical protein [Consotaella salsifontis]|uniref:Uncharacterized protein n=1 Tax=Consotaella salsifontis TaxID=1365950 RepID=A0A1T4L7S1_9HYPH|nr:hypothetical protein [Consotaella salsifontis]SJZ50765.1 hypothetical protein SAMN05428963_10199 [Consotaella salsifontis]
MAQSAPIPSFLDRSLRGFEDHPSGAYASPSAIPGGGLVPTPDAVGVPRTGPLKTLNPIALPEGFGKIPVPNITVPGLPAYAPQPVPQLLEQPRRALALEARLVEDGQAVPSGVVWRLFSPIPGSDGKLPLVATATGGAVTLDVAPGSYILHAAYGRAGITKRINFTGLRTRELVVLECGGLKLNAVLADHEPVPADKLLFDVYTAAANERDRQMIATGVTPGQTLRLNAGTYQVVSHYGSDNAVVRADIRVEAGKLTEATVEHHAAQLTFKLVREEGGEAIADTAWSVSTPSGDVIRESVGAFPSMILAEGDYVVVARNKDHVYQREFEVVSSANTDVEVMTSDALGAPGAEEGSGD